MERREPICIVLYIIAADRKNFISGKQITKNQKRKEKAAVTKYMQPGKRLWKI